MVCNHCRYCANEQVTISISDRKVLNRQSLLESSHRLSNYLTWWILPRLSIAGPVGFAHLKEKHEK